MFTSILGKVFFASWQCDCFSSPGFIDNRHVLQHASVVSLVYTSDRVGVISRSRFSNSMKNGDGDDYNEAVDVDTTKSLMELLSPISSCRVNQMSGTDLAYIGDVVFELFVRSRHVWPSKRTSDLQNTVVGLVRGRQFVRSIYEKSPLEIR